MLIVLNPVLGVELCQVAVSWAVSGTVWRVGFKDLVVGRLNESLIRRDLQAQYVVDLFCLFVSVVFFCLFL